MAKLTKYDVIDINRKIANGMDSSELASNYGVVTSTIRKIENGQSWKNVESPKTIKDYECYEITSNGKVYSTLTNRYMAVHNGTVRLSDLTGNRDRIQVDMLMKTYYPCA